MGEAELPSLPSHVTKEVVRREAILPGLTMALVIGCGDSPRDSAPPPAAPTRSPIERTIEQQLGRKLGRTLEVACSSTRCRADLGDTVIPIALTTRAGEVDWAVDGLLVRAQPIEAYLRGALTDLGAPQAVSCGVAIRSVEPGARIECTLARGGKAFAVIAADGSFSTEIALDPGAAAARSVEPNQPLVDPAAGSGSAAPDE